MITVRLKIDGAFQDVTQFVKPGSVKRSFSLYKELQPNSNTASFVLQRNVEGNALIDYFLITNNEIDVEIDKDGIPFFRGIVSPNWSLKETASEIGSFEVKCEDYSLTKLGKEITEDISLAGYHICTASGTSSIVHYICSLAGITIANPVDILINVTLLTVSSSDKKTYGDILKEILFEARYSYYLNASNQLVLYRWDGWSTASITKTFKNDPAMPLESNIGDIFTVKRGRASYDRIQVKWNTLIYQPNSLLFSDTTNGDSSTPCNIEVAAGAYHPLDSNTRDVECQYMDNGNVGNKSYKYLYSIPPRTLDATYNGLTLERSELYNDKAFLRFYNGSGITQRITKLNIRGNAYYIAEENSTESLIAANVKKTYEYKCRHLTLKSDADALRIALVNYYKAADITLKFYSPTKFELGDYVKIDDKYRLRFITYGRILEIEEYEEGFYSYLIEAIDEYLPNPAANTSKTINPLPPVGQTYFHVRYSANSDGNPMVTTPDRYIGTVVTYDSVAPVDYASYTWSQFKGEDGVIDYTALQEGYDQGGGTTTPEIPLNISFVPGKFSIAIKVGSKQLNLTNYSHYEIQGSTDSTNWYSLRFDGVDWKDTQNATTTFQDGILIHTLGRNADSNGNPQAYSIKYRLRQATKKGVTSAWYTSSTYTTSLLIDGSDIVANSITAAKLDVNAINSQIGNFSQTIRISPSGFQGQTFGVNDTPTYNERRNYLDQDELTIQDFTLNATGFNLLTDYKNNIVCSAPITSSQRIHSFAPLVHDTMAILYTENRGGSLNDMYIGIMKKDPTTFKYEIITSTLLQTTDNTTRWVIPGGEIYACGNTNQLVYRYALRKNEASVWNDYDRVGSVIYDTGRFINPMSYDRQRIGLVDTSKLLHGDNMNYDFLLLYQPYGGGNRTDGVYYNWRSGNYINAGTVTTNVCTTAMTITGFDDWHYPISNYGIYAITTSEGKNYRAYVNTSNTTIVDQIFSGSVAGGSVYALEYRGYTGGYEYPMVFMKDTGSAVSYDIICWDSVANGLIWRTQSTKTLSTTSGNSPTIYTCVSGSTPSYFFSNYRKADTYHLKVYPLTVNNTSTPYTLSIGTVKDITLPSEFITNITNDEYKLVSRQWANNNITKANYVMGFLNIYDGKYKFFEGGYKLDWQDGIVIGRGTNNITCDTVTAKKVQLVTGSFNYGDSVLNYIANGNFESGVSGWYQSGTGFRLDHYTTYVLAGNASARLYKATTNTTDYVYYPFTIENRHKGKTLQLQFDYSANLNDGIITWAIVDVTAGTNVASGNLPSGNGKFIQSFTCSTNTSYRLKFASGGVSTYEAYFTLDEVKVIEPPRIVTGTSTFAGNSTARVIPHGLSYTPVFVGVTPSANPGTTLGSVWYTTDGTNISVYNSGASVTAFNWIAY